MPPTIGGVRIDPQGQTLTVTITPSAKVYTDAAGTTLASFPATITTQTSYYVSAAQQFTVSCKNPQGVEIADGYGNALVMDIQQGVMEGIAPVLNQPGPEQVSQFGTWATRRRLITNPLPYGGALTPNSSSPIRMVGRDATDFTGTDGASYYVNSNRTGILCSTDGELSVPGKGLPAGVSSSTSNTLERLCLTRFGPHVYAVLHETASGVRKVYRFTPVYGVGVVTWEGPLFSLHSGADGYPTCMDTDGQYLYLGEYGDPLVGGVKTASLYRLSLANALAGGTAWETILTGNSVMRHWHAVAADPYNPGHVWATGGDGGAGTYIIVHSTDHGATWTTVTTDSRWQSVQISFSANYVWFASDQDGVSVNVWDRAAGALKVASTGNHAGIAVPDQLAEGIVIADGNTTAGSPNISSPTQAQFNAATDVGAAIVGDGIPAGTTIASVTSATQAVMSQNAIETCVGNLGTFRLKRAVAVGSYTQPDTFFSKCWFGRVDPATEAYYFVANASVIGCRQGLFWVPQIGESPRLIESVPWKDNAFGKLYLTYWPQKSAWYLRYGTRACPLPTLD